MKLGDVSLAEPRFSRELFRPRVSVVVVVAVVVPVVFIVATSGD